MPGLRDSPDAEKEKATGFFWRFAVTRTANSMTVPYSEEYREFLEPAAKLLREAAALTTNQSLERFSDQARRRVCFQRLLRERRRLDGSRFAD